MALNDAILVIRNVVVEGFQNIFYSNEKSKKYTNMALIAILLGVVGYTGFYLRRWYLSNREARAQKIFAECLREVNKARKGKGSWYDAQIALQIGYQDHSSSRLAPFLLFFKADTLIEQDNKVEAIKVLKDGLQRLSEKSPFYSLYKTKLALVKLDMDEEMQKQGLDDLEEIACVKDETAGTSAALFYLGSYYWAKEDIAKAIEYWQKLISWESRTKDMGMTYAKIAQEKLKQIGI